MFDLFLWFLAAAAVLGLALTLDGKPDDGDPPERDVW